MNVNNPLVGLVLLLFGEHKGESTIATFELNSSGRVEIIIE